MFLTDMFEHLHVLNLALQGNEKNIIDLSQAVFSFEFKLRLFVNDFENKIFIDFPFLKTNVTNFKVKKLDENKEKLEKLQADFKHRFEDLKCLKSTFSYFLNLFICDINEDGFSISEIILTEKAAGELELLEMKEDQALRERKCSTNLFLYFNFGNSCQNLSKYLQLKKAACRLFSIFGTTYCCESLFFTMKFMKSKYRS